MIYLPKPPKRITKKNKQLHQKRRTRWHEDGDGAEEATDDHEEAQRPSATPTVHDGPAEHVTRQFDQAGQEKGQVLVAAHRRSVVGQAHIHCVVGEPGERQYTLKYDLYLLIVSTKIDMLKSIELFLTTRTKKKIIFDG